LMEGRIVCKTEEPMGGGRGFRGEKSLVFKEEENGSKGRGRK